MVWCPKALMNQNNIQYNIIIIFYPISVCVWSVPMKKLFPTVYRTNQKATSVNSFPFLWFAVDGETCIQISFTSSLSIAINNNHCWIMYVWMWLIVRFIGYSGYGKLINKLDFSIFKSSDASHSFEEIYTCWWDEFRMRQITQTNNNKIINCLKIENSPFSWPHWHWQKIDRTNYLWKRTS